MEWVYKTIHRSELTGEAGAGEKNLERGDGTRQDATLDPDGHVEAAAGLGVIQQFENYDNFFD